MIRMSCPNEGGAGSCVVSTSVSLLRKTATSSKPRAQNNGQKTASTQKKRSEASMLTSSISGSRLDSEEPEMSQVQIQPPSSTTTTITTMSTTTTPQAQPQKKPQKLRRRVATMAQRRAANIRERRRMFNLNSAFDRLRKKVPSFAYEKRLSRIETLKLAIMYIRFMDDLVKDEAYAEKYKRLTSNYPPQLPSVPATISNHTNELMAHSAATFMSPYLSTLYGRCDSPPPSAPSPDSLLLHPLQHQQQQRHLNERTRPTKLEPDLEATTDRERYLLASSADGTTQNIMQRQLCTDSHCASARQHYDHQLHYGSISAAASCSPSTTAPTATTVATPTLHNPSIGGAGAASNSAASSVVCCSSPALSSSCNSSSASTCNSSSSSSSLNSFANDSPDPSPHQLQQLHQAPQFQQQPLIYSASTDYYQKQQQAYGGAYPLDQTTPCLPMYATAATTTVTGQAGNQSSEPASKMFAFGYESADNARRQGQTQAGESQIAGRRSLAEYCIEPASVSSSPPPTAATATNLAPASLSMGEQQQQHHHHSGHPLGYTLHSLQAR